jgi:hypothetical protein
MSVKLRLESIEKRLPSRGVCPHGWMVVHTNEDDQDLNTITLCPECGKPRNIIKVVHVSNWRGRDRDDWENDD